MRELLESVIDEAKRQSLDFADLRVHQQEGTSINVQDGRADKVYHGISLGAGVRVLSGGAWGFASTNTVTKEQLLDCLDQAARLAKSAQRKIAEKAELPEIAAVQDAVNIKPKVDPRDIALEDKMKVVFELEKAAKACDPQRICNTSVSYREGQSTVSVANTAGTYVETTLPRTHLGAFVTACENGVRQMGSEHFGGLYGWELVENTKPEQLTVRASQVALDMLKASEPPSGKFPVILDSAVTGLFTHEAIGHNAEADHVWSGESILEGKMGQQVASELVTIVDDPTIEGKNGSFPYDSEGTPTRRREVVRKGILSEFLHSLETAHKFGVEPNGAARAQGHGNRPIVRMSNTFIERGDWTLEEMVSGIKEGLYLSGGFWGYVFCERGQFTCNVEQGRMIRDGELQERLRNVSVSGMTLEALMSIDAVGKELVFKLPGMCGKGGQGADIDAGGPHIRVKELVVGGRR